MKYLFTLLCALLVLSCTSRDLYRDYDISFSRSGGLSPVYENFLINGKEAHYSIEGQGKNFKKNFRITAAELSDLQAILKENNFRHIQTDHRKLYDHITTSITVKTGSESAVKNDGSGIQPADQQRWENITRAFEGLAEKYTGRQK